MSCEVAALPFQAKANYGTWPTAFDLKPVYATAEKPHWRPGTPSCRTLHIIPFVTKKNEYIYLRKYVRCL